MSGSLAYESDYRRELRHQMIDGRVVMMSSPSMRQYDIAANLYRIFDSCLRGKPCRAFLNGPTVHFSEKERYIPDVLVLCDRNKIRGDGIHGAPDLIVEVLSPSTARYDRGHKMDVYAKYGVPEYWIVDPKAKSVEQ